MLHLEQVQPIHIVLHVRPDTLQGIWYVPGQATSDYKQPKDCTEVAVKLAFSITISGCALSRICMTLVGAGTVDHTPHHD